MLNDISSFMNLFTAFICFFCCERYVFLEKGLESGKQWVYYAFSALLVFGSNKLSGLGKALGTSIREFKEEVKNPGNAEAKEGGENDSKSAKE